MRKQPEHDVGTNEGFFSNLQTEQHICMLIAMLRQRGEINNAEEKGEISWNDVLEWVREKGIQCPNGRVGFRQKHDSFEVAEEKTGHQYRMRERMVWGPRCWFWSQQPMVSAINTYQIEKVIPALLSSQEGSTDLRRLNL